VNGDFFTIGGAMQQFTQIPAGFLNVHRFHAQTLMVD
jgi:hypothetical protein